MGFYRIKRNYADIYYQYVPQSQYHISPRQEQMGSNISSAHILLAQSEGYVLIYKRSIIGRAIGRRAVILGRKQQRLATSRG